MNAWTFGPLVLSGEVLIIAAAVAIAYAVMKLRLRSALPEGSSYERAFEALLIWVVVWKVSVFLFKPQETIENPMMLLYYSGGSKGAWLAALLAAAYVVYKDYNSSFKTVYIDSWLMSILAGYTAYRIAAIILQEGHMITNGAIAFLGAIFIGSWWIREPQAGRGKVQTLVVAFVIAHAILNTLAVNTWEKPASIATAEDAEGLPVGIRIGQRAPDFELKTLDGTSVKLSDFRGKKVLVNFWATWCPPCRVEMPVMQKFYSEYKDKDIVILSVNATQTELNTTIVQSFVDHWGLTFPVVLDADGQVGKTYQIAAYPATYTVDEHGIVRKKHQGAMDEEMLIKAAR